MSINERVGTADIHKSSEPTIGIVEWLRPGEYGRAERLVDDLRALGVTELRTQFSWADWHTAEGTAWYDWLIPYLASAARLLPCFVYTPPSLGLTPKTASPPRNPKAYADFLDLILTRLGDHFEWVELWNEPNNLNDWDWRLDPSWILFADMIGKAAYWAQRRGKKTVLGGMCPTDPNWLDLMGRRGVLQYIDAVGVHGFPGTWEFDWEDWSYLVGKIRQVLNRYRLDTEIWITEAGYSTWRHDDFHQLQEFAKLIQAPAQRVYWYAGYDLPPDVHHQDGFHEDERHYHFGLKYADGQPKLLFRIWENEGLEGIEALSAAGRAAAANLQRAPAAHAAPEMQAPNAANKTAPQRQHTQRRPVLITGGAGFIGANLAHRLLSAGRPVLILDNLSRPGVEQNLRWLYSLHSNDFQVAISDIRDSYIVRNAVRRAEQIFHFAAQVAVTTSLSDPLKDFEVNVQGTLNVLEALRAVQQPPPLVFTSTNKVYGALGDIELRRAGRRYEPQDPQIHRNGISECRSLDFHSPYGCSKGAADQYVLDYARIYGLPAAVLRMSCIYGPHQYGTEDQGWVAHFLIRTLEGQPLTLYGDGMQVRDVLFVNDLLDAMLLAHEYIGRIQGQAFNIGGGPDNSISLLELVNMIDELHHFPLEVRFSQRRAGDQKYYVSDTRKFAAATGWAPRTKVHNGVGDLYEWLQASRSKDAKRETLSRVWYERPLERDAEPWARERQ